MNLTIIVSRFCDFTDNKDAIPTDHRLYAKTDVETEDTWAVSQRIITRLNKLRENRPELAGANLQYDGTADGEFVVLFGHVTDNTDADGLLMVAMAAAMDTELVSS